MPADAADDQFIQNLGALIPRLPAESPAPVVPSRHDNPLKEMAWNIKKRWIIFRASRQVVGRYTASNNQELMRLALSNPRAMMENHV